MSSITILPKSERLVATLIMTVVFLLCVVVFHIQEDIKWTTNFGYILAMGIAGGLFLTGFVSTLKLSLRSGLLLFFAAGAVAAGFGGALMGVSLFWFVCWCIGVCLNFRQYNNVTVDETPSLFSRGLFSNVLLSGYIIVTLTLTVIVYTPFNFPIIYIVIFGLPSLLGIILISKSSHRLFDRRKEKVERNWSDIFTFLPLAIVLSLLFVFALQPDLGSDSLAAYRSILLQLRDYGQFTYAPDQTTIGLLQLSGLWPQSFSVTMSGQYEAAKLMNFSMLLAAVFIAQDLDLKVKSSPVTNLILAICLSIPVFLNTTISGFYDNAIFFLAFGFIFLTERLVQTADVENTEIKAILFQAAILSLLSGLMILTKGTTLFIAPVLAVYLIARLFQYLRNTTLLMVVLIIGVGGALVWGAFLLFVYLQSGNPVFPYYNNIFESPFNGPQSFNSPHTGYMSWRLLWDLTFESAKYAQVGTRDGVFGIIAIVFISSFGLWLWMARRVSKNISFKILLGLGCFIASLILVSATENSTRYLIIVLPFLVIPLTLTFQELGRMCAILVTCVIIGVQIFTMPNFGWSQLTPSGVIAINHDDIIKRFRPLRDVSDRMSKDYGRSGNILFLNDNAGFTGRAFTNAWYDYLTLVKFKKIQTDSPDGLVEFLKTNSIDAVVLSGKGQRALKSSNLLPLLTYLSNLSTDVERFGSATVYRIGPELSFSGVNMLEETTYQKTHQFTNLSNVQNIIFDMNYKCLNIRALRLIALNPEGKWSYYKDFIPICDETFESVHLEFRNLHPENKYLIQSVASPESSLQVLGGVVYSRP